MAYYCVQATCASAATLLTGLGTAFDRGTDGTNIWSMRIRGV